MKKRAIGQMNKPVFFTVLAGLILAVMAVPPAVSFVEGSGASEEAQRVMGYVAALDWIGSTITVEFGDDVNANDQRTFSVSEKTTITRAGKTIAFLDIQEGDSVTIDYAEDKNSGTFIARHIADLNVDNE